MKKDQETTFSKEMRGVVVGILQAIVMRLELELSTDRQGMGKSQFFRLAFLEKGGGGRSAKSYSFYSTSSRGSPLRILSSCWPPFRGRIRGFPGRSCVYTSNDYLKNWHLPSKLLLLPERIQTLFIFLFFYRFNQSTLLYLNS